MINEMIYGTLIHLPRLIMKKNIYIYNIVLIKTTRLPRTSRTNYTPFYSLNQIKYLQGVLRSRFWCTLGVKTSLPLDKACKMWEEKECGTSVNLKTNLLNKPWLAMGPTCSLAKLWRCNEIRCSWSSELYLAHSLVYKRLRCLFRHRGLALLNGSLRVFLVLSFRAASHYSIGLVALQLGRCRCA